MDRSNIKKMWIADQGDGTYKNPILYTDYSDPDAIRVGEDYYMIASSFCNTPAVPVLHSKDLVNWKVISYAFEQLPFDYYDRPMHGCGAWAPAIRYNEGIFYIFIPLPDEGIVMVKSKDPFKGWDEPTFVRKVVGWIDPCPFWDDDGQAYMVTAFARSRIGFKSILHLSPMKPDCTDVLGDGKHIYDGSETQPTIEGPKLYKRNGYYYIFAPAGGVKPGWQTVLRSKNIWGPYEEKIVMHQGSSSVNGPHQGAWIDTPSGEDWFIHFQDVGNAGRIVHLQPMRWVDDWPIIGINEDENGCGEPVLSYQKPNVGNTYPIDAPADSDFFDENVLGLQWQWNANYKKDWYSLGEGGITLYAKEKDPKAQVCDISNLLLQKWPAPEFMITTKLDLSGMVEGDVCGMVSLGGIYTDLAVFMKEGKKQFVQRIGEWTKDNEVEKKYDTLDTNTVFIRMVVKDSTEVSFSYSLDEKSWDAIGETIETTAGRWVGVKAGLFAVNEIGNTGGYMKAEYFVFQEL